MPRHISPRNVNLLLVLFFVGFPIALLRASSRTPGKYSGVVIFDRWDDCLLLSGVYVMYVSGQVKEGLRVYRDQAVQIDASDVKQPLNPGDGLVRKFSILGPAPQVFRDDAPEGSRIEVKSDFSHGRAIVFLIRVENSGRSPIAIDTNAIGPTVLGPRIDHPFTAADGNSLAWITRTPLLKPTSWSATVQGHSFSVAYAPDPKTSMPERFNLAPLASTQVAVSVALPPGQYEFLVGFGGGVHEGRSLASNAITFHVEPDGSPVLDDLQADAHRSQSNPIQAK